MKIKYLFLIGILFLIMGFISGCGSESPAKAETETQPATESETQTTPPTEPEQEEEAVDEPQETTENILGHSRSNPASKGTALTTEVKNWFEEFKATITLTDFKRGSTAWSMIKEANMFNDEPSEGKEYILAKVKFKLLENKNEEAYRLTEYDFKAVSKNGLVYGLHSVVEPEPQLSAELYPGASYEGWVAFEVDKSDNNPLISFKRGEEGELWFKLY